MLTGFSSISFDLGRCVLPQLPGISLPTPPPQLTLLNWTQEDDILTLSCVAATILRLHPAPFALTNSDIKTGPKVTVLF